MTTATHSFGAGQLDFTAGLKAYNFFPCALRL